MNVAEALEAIATPGRFDVVLLDYALPGTVGFEGLQRVLEANGAGVVLFSGHVPSNVIDRALAMGAMGYIPKTTALKTLENALRLVAGGAAYVPVILVTGPAPEREIAAALAEIAALDGVVDRPAVAYRIEDFE